MSRKKWLMKFVFGMQINIEVFYKFILSFWVFLAKHAQSTQNKKCACLYSISRKTWGMKLIFCRQINTNVFYKLIVSLWVCVARHAQRPKEQVCNIFAISRGKCEGWSCFFASRATSKTLSNWHYHFRCVWPGMSKITIMASFLFLCNILRKKWVMIGKHESFLQIDAMI